MSESILAIVGGGRWGQLLLSILTTMDTPFDRIVMVSKTAKRTDIEILPTLEDLFTKYFVTAAIVVNAAGQHFETAKQLIDRGIHVLIEKPIVPSLKQMQILIDQANDKNVCIVPGLTHRFCSYIKEFSQLVAAKELPKRFIFRWSDMKNETRHGQVKRYDHTITVAQDVMPHIWTILTLIFPNMKMSIQSCVQDNSNADLRLSMNTVEGQVLLRRDGDSRERFLLLEYDLDSLEYDFAEQKPGALARQLEYYFSVIRNGKSSSHDLEDCLNSVHFTELVSSY